MKLARLRHFFDRSPASESADERAWRFTARSASALLQPFDGDVAAIRARIGVPPEHWRRLYLSVLHNYAALVQQLPASESHHHAGVDGLLQHGLEVVRNTLDLQQGVMLPRGADPEDQARLQDLWTYACFTAALLHDLGKPVTDQRIPLYDNHGNAQGVWTPLRGPMAEGTPYDIAFNRQRVYRQHERIPPLLAHHLIPSEGLSWIASDADALMDWLTAIQGDLNQAGAIGEIIGQADGLSVARNLSGSTNVQLPQARAKPLAERLVTGLRYLLDNQQLPLNRRGAAGFVDGNALWLVSKTALDKLRTHLIEEGQPGIPSRNDRLMDELQQHGLLIPNDDRAVWLCAITIGDWQQKLTCLRFDADRIWPDANRRHDPVAGSVNPVQEGGVPEAVEQSNKSTATDQSPHTETNGNAAAPSHGPTANLDSSTASSPAVVDDLPLPFEPESSSTTQNVPVDGRPASPATSRGDKRDAPDRSQEISQPQDAGQRFVDWLVNKIENEDIEINSPKARVHVIPEGLALVSPGIFKDFDADKWNHVQKRFQKLGLHRKTAKDENIWTCQIEGSRKQAILKMILIPDAAATLGVELPESNTAISLLEP